MLAGKADLKKLKYPLYVSPKIDGVRGIVYDNTLRSRSWKEFPNKYVQKLFSTGEFNGIDGELVLGSPTAKDVYRVTNAALQRHDGEPKVHFYVFDYILAPEDSFRQRLGHLVQDFLGNKNISIVDQRLVNNEKMLLEAEEEFIEKGYEGIMLRGPEGKYKYGRSTVKGGELLKLKRFEDSEAEIIGYEEEMHNANEAKKNAFGRTERSSHQANLVGKGRLGALLVRDIHTKVEFKIGTGFDETERIDLWQSRDKLEGQIVKYKSFKIGVKNKPRHPVYLGPRSEWDL